MQAQISHQRVGNETSYQKHSTNQNYSGNYYSNQMANMSVSTVKNQRNPFDQATEANVSKFIDL